MFIALCMLLAVASAIRLDLKTHQPLQITVLTESLCPNCREFITNSYARAIQAEGIELLANITIVPFGNTKEVKKDDHFEYTCQHGEKECQGNMLQSCLFAHVDKKRAERMLVCVDSKITAVDGDWLKAFNDCGDELKIDLKKTLYCAHSKEGNALMHRTALKSDPSHQYVPWIIVNGKHDVGVESKIIEDLVGYACSQYTGKVPVPACQAEASKKQITLGKLKTLLEKLEKH